MTLEQEGYQVRTYTDGESALQGLLAKPDDLAVLDIKMPRMDGLEAARRIAALTPPDAARAVPIVGLSALSQDADREHARAHGMSHYVAKPVRYADIARLLDALRPGARASSIPDR